MSALRRIVVAGLATVSFSMNVEGACAQAHRLEPIDEAVRDPELFLLRARILADLAEGDLDAVAAVADSNIKLSFGGDYGAETFRSLLEDASYRGELATALALGGVFEGEEIFTTPYTFDRFPSDVDGYEGLVALGDAVPVYAEPDRGSARIDTLSFDVVLTDRDAGWVTGWNAIELDDGKVGWVESANVRSPIDYRARFSRVEGRWRMTFFLAGD